MKPNCIISFLSMPSFSDKLDMLLKNRYLAKARHNLILKQSHFFTRAELAYLERDRISHKNNNVPLL